MTEKNVLYWVVKYTNGKTGINIHSINFLTFADHQGMNVSAEYRPRIRWFLPQGTCAHGAYSPAAERQLWNRELQSEEPRRGVLNSPQHASWTGGRCGPSLVQW